VAHSSEVVKQAEQGYHRLTPAARERHPRPVQPSFWHIVALRRSIAATLAVIMALGACGLCTGWEAVAEARMADSATCPLHEASADGVASSVSQAAMARCCVASDQDESTPPESASMPRVDVGQPVDGVPVAIHPAVASFDVRRSLRPPPGHLVPTHLLFSVFLI
jgi:hypothetical protein